MLSSFQTLRNLLTNFNVQSNTCTFDLLLSAFEMAFDGNCQVCKQPIQSRCFTIISLDAFSN